MRALRLRKAANEAGCPYLDELSTIYGAVVKDLGIIWGHAILTQSAHFAEITVACYHERSICAFPNSS